MNDSRMKFRAAFLEECAHMGLSLAQIEKVARQAEISTTIAAGLDERSPMCKNAFVREVVSGLRLPVDVVSRLAPYIGTLALAGLIGVPLVAGTTLGGAVGQAVDDDTNIEEAKTDELLSQISAEQSKIAP